MKQPGFTKIRSDVKASTLMQLNDLVKKRAKDFSYVDETISGQTVKLLKILFLGRVVVT